MSAVRIVNNMPPVCYSCFQTCSIITQGCSIAHLTCPLVEDANSQQSARHAAGQVGAGLDVRQESTELMDWGGR